MEKGSDGLVGAVRFTGSYMECAEKSGGIKEAEHRAAYEALKQLKYLKKGDKFNWRKRKGEGVSNMETNVKQVKPGTVVLSPDATTSKTLLFHIASKNKWGAPTYNTVTLPNGFFSTVTVDNTQFKCMSIHKLKKDAENDAADVALKAMKPFPSTEMETTKANLSIGAKTRLQNYSQKASKELPEYDTTYNEDDKTYQTVVTVDGIEYCGAPKAGKKKAEGAAAEEALMGLIKKGFLV